MNGLLKTGAAAQAAAEEYEKKVIASSGPRRFFLNKPSGDPQDTNNSALITFLDGVVGADGLLEMPPSMLEHQINHNGSWDHHYACIAADGPCPLCEQRKDNPSYCSYFTIINHTGYKDGKDGWKQKGQNRKAIFVAKSKTMKILQHLATTHGTLRGLTVQATRLDGAPNVGGIFEHKKTQTDKAEFVAMCGGGEVDMSPINYGEVLNFLTAAQMVEAGLVNPTHTVGGAAAPVNNSVSPSGTPGAAPEPF